MADAKRWSVTYTKHVKQKRKVYQDGFLELHASTNKVWTLIFISLSSIFFSFARSSSDGVSVRDRVWISLISSVFASGWLRWRIRSQLLLYDDCEKLLECRILKRDETVSCGETLAFNAFLVDVNGAEGHHAPPPPPASSSLGRGNRSVTEKSKSQKLNSSPSHQIIRGSS